MKNLTLIYAVIISLFISCKKENAESEMLAVSMAAADTTAVAASEYYEKDKVSDMKLKKD